jgi:hypothetical protein
MSNPPTRPPPPAKPGQVKVYKALYDYTSQNPDELSFSEGDVLYIMDMLSNKNWWTAKCNEKVGLVPCNYSKYSFFFIYFFQNTQFFI